MLMPKSVVLGMDKVFAYIYLHDQFKIGEAAHLLDVSTDTVRRWVDGGRLRGI
jgi:DNA-directed RNA polymerase specialized sigma24 family protein